jgi:hypothetical protein
MDLSKKLVLRHNNNIEQSPRNPLTIDIKTSLTVLKLNPDVPPLLHSLKKK